MLNPDSGSLVWSDTRYCTLLYKFYYCEVLLPFKKMLQLTMWRKKRLVWRAYVTSGCRSVKYPLPPRNIICYYNTFALNKCTRIEIMAFKLKTYLLKKIYSFSHSDGYYMNAISKESVFVTVVRAQNAVKYLSFRISFYIQGINYVFSIIQGHCVTYTTDVFYFRMLMSFNSTILWLKKPF